VILLGAGGHAASAACLPASSSVAVALGVGVAAQLFRNRPVNQRPSWRVLAPHLLSAPRLHLHQVLFCVIVTERALTEIFIPSPFLYRFLFTLQKISQAIRIHTVMGKHECKG